MIVGAVGLVLSKNKERTKSLMSQIIIKASSYEVQA
jgi:hypothetical protein